MKRLWNKKIITRALCILLVAVVAAWAFAPKNSYAAGIDVGSALNNSLLIFGILYVLRGAFTVLLGIVSGFLDIAYLANLNSIPAQLTVAQQGWLVLRDLANGLLILVLVWIAITIIFNLEEYGGKKLLVRVIAAGLLMNFSLVFVTVPFAIGNELSKPFAKAIGVYPPGANCKKDSSGKQTCPSLGQVIVNNSQIHQVTDISEQGALQRAKQEFETLGQQPILQPSQEQAQVWQYLGAPQTAHAVPALGTIAACGLLGIATFGWGAVICGIISTVVTAGITYGLYKLNVLGPLVTQAVDLIIANLLMFLMVISLFVAAVILYLRLFAMILLAVFAPLAFISLAIPRYGDRIWNPWLDNLFRWAFAAPVFYFLLYLALLMLQLNRPQAPSLTGVRILDNPLMMINLILFLIFLWAAVYFTRKMAGQFAEIALSGLRRGLGYAGGYGLGVLQRHALPKLGQVAETAGVKIGEIKSPFLRGLLRQPAGAFRQVAKAGRDQIVKDQQRLGSMTSQEIQRAIGASEFSESELAAAMMILQTRKDLTPMKDSQGNNIRGYDDAAQRRGVDTIRRTGLDIVGFLRANPMIARPGDFRTDQMDRVKNAAGWTEAEQRVGRQLADEEFAQWLAWQRVRPEDMRAMDLGILDNDTMKQMYLLSAKAAHLSQLGQYRPDVARRINDYLTADETRMRQTLDQMDEGAINYFYTNAAGELGWRIPPGVLPALGASTRLHEGTAGQPYEPADLQPSGGTEPYVFTIVETRPPTPDFRIDDQGVLHGDPQTSGDYQITVKMTDRGGAGRSTQRQFRVVIK